MSRPLHGVVALILVVLISAPVSIVATLVLLPLWRWVEASTGIESIGHSGPAEWCYFVMFVLVGLGALAVVWMKRRRR